LEGGERDVNRFKRSSRLPYPCVIVDNESDYFINTKEVYCDGSQKVIVL
jgi:hypothetical protein